MQGWEYAYVYVVNPSGLPTSAEKVIVLADAKAPRVLSDFTAPLAAINALGALGWIVSQETSYGQQLGTGWLIDLLRREDDLIKIIFLENRYFMRRPLEAGTSMKAGGRPED